VKQAATNAQARARTGLRKNFSVSKPSTGASLAAPPMAESQPPTLPIRSTAATGARDLDSSAVRAQATTTMNPTQAPPTDQRIDRSCTTRPRKWSCIGMKYFDWSSSRR
jgi:hypothetical protein